MKVILEWVGLFSGGGLGIKLIGGLHKYSPWEIFFLFFFVLLFSIVFGGVGAWISQPIDKFIDKWIGKKKLKRSA